MEDKKNLIVSKLAPKVPLKELWTPDTDNPSIHNPFFKRGNKGIQTSGPDDTIGSKRPFVKINSLNITEIESLVIDETGFIPRIKISFTDTSGSLSGPNYPKNDPILSVYIKTLNPNFKPIRCDFLITSIKSDLDAFAQDDIISRTTEFVMTGELFIPKIYDNVSKSYDNMTSKDALLEIAKDLDLGFAVNDFLTEDSMTWINPNRNYIYFIQNIAKHAYLNDDTFFKVFIDKYYHLNFVNVTEQLNPTNAMNLTYINDVDSGLINKNMDTAENPKDNPTIIALTNSESFKGKPEHIIKYRLLGDTGRILKNKGYNRKIYYYDHTIEDDKFVSFYINSANIEGYNANDSKSSRLIPDNETLKKSIVKKWMNIDYGNTHREWNASVLINDHNNSELNKVKLGIETRGTNFQISNGAAVDVNIVLAKSDANRQNAHDINADDEDFSLNQSEMVKDTYISGKYFVNGMKYIFDKDFEFITEFHMSRTNWITEKNTVEDNA